ncbi:MAG TPA: KH domain-containing protein [Candidatus Atribacteria bacterium]|nr:KH domain-containing protein [Candidatus Atribacteria bacterium]
MKELVEYLVKALVDNPEQAKVTKVEGEQSVIYEVRVAPEDMGKIIGKQGRIAKAIRTIVRAACVKNGKKAIVEILE